MSIKRCYHGNNSKSCCRGVGKDVGAHREGIVKLCLPARRKISHQNVPGVGGRRRAHKCRRPGGVGSDVRSSCFQGLRECVGAPLDGWKEEGDPVPMRGQGECGLGGAAWSPEL